MYYSLTNYYQNHRRYVKSRDDYQLRGEDVGYGSLTGSDCKPFVGNDSTHEAYAPCGVIANSMFNGKPRRNTPCTCKMYLLVMTPVLMYLLVTTQSVRLTLHAVPLLTACSMVNHMLVLMYLLVTTTCTDVLIGDDSINEAYAPCSAIANSMFNGKPHACTDVLVGNDYLYWWTYR